MRPTIKTIRDYTLLAAFCACLLALFLAPDWCERLLENEPPRFPVSEEERTRAAEDSQATIEALFEWEQANHRTALLRLWQAEDREMLDARHVAEDRSALQRDTDRRRQEWTRTEELIRLSNAEYKAREKAQAEETARDWDKAQRDTGEYVQRVWAHKPPRRGEE